MTRLCQNYLILFLQDYEPKLCCCTSLYDFLTNCWFYYFFLFLRHRCLNYPYQTIEFCFHIQHLAYASIYDPDYSFSVILWILLEAHVVQFEHTFQITCNSQYYDRACYMGWKPTMCLFLVQPDSFWPFICPSMIQIPRSLAVTGSAPFLRQPARSFFSCTGCLLEEACRASHGRQRSTYLIAISTCISISLTPWRRHPN